MDAYVFIWASLVAQPVKNLPAMQETVVRFLGWEDLLEKGQGYPLQYSWVSLVVHACNVGNLGLIPGLGRSPGGGYGNPLQYPCLENSMDRGSWWVGYSPRGHKELDTTVTFN